MSKVIIQARGCEIPFSTVTAAIKPLYNTKGHGSSVTIRTNGDIYCGRSCYKAVLQELEKLGLFRKDVLVFQHQKDGTRQYLYIPEKKPDEPVRKRPVIFESNKSERKIPPEDLKRVILYQLNMSKLPQDRAFALNFALVALTDGLDAGFDLHRISYPKIKPWNLITFNTSENDKGKKRTQASLSILDGLSSELNGSVWNFVHEFERERTGVDTSKVTLNLAEKAMSDTVASIALDRTRLIPFIDFARALPTSATKLQ